MDRDNSLAAFQALIYLRAKTASQPLPDSPESLEPDTSNSDEPADGQGHKYTSLTHDFASNIRLAARVRPVQGMGSILALAP